MAGDPQLARRQRPRRRTTRRGRKLDPRIPLRAEPRRRPPKIVTAECPRCGVRFGTKFEFCVHICKCGWFHKIEPIPSYGHVDGGFAVSVDDVMQVEAPGWEERGDPPNRELRREAVRKVLENWRRRKVAGEFETMIRYLREDERIELGIGGSPILRGLTTEEPS